MDVKRHVYTYLLTGETTDVDEETTADANGRDDVGDISVSLASTDAYRSV